MDDNLYAERIKIENERGKDTLEIHEFAATEYRINEGEWVKLNDQGRV